MDFPQLKLLFDRWSGVMNIDNRGIEDNISGWKIRR